MKLGKKLLAGTLAVSLLASGSMTVSAEQMQSPTVENEAIELRSTLDHYLSEHAFLAVEVMRKGAEGAEDFNEAASALSQNTEDLTAAIASVYGDEAGQQFNKMWSEHIGYFVDYVKATGADDKAAKEEALNHLSQYKEDFAKFLETATGERLEAGALAEGLQMHVNQLIGAFDAYVAGDYAKAYKYEREAINHMYMVSKGLSQAIADQFPEKFNSTIPTTKAADLRSNLNHLLSEHAGLAVMTMQNGIDGAEDFEASANALSQNTEELSNAIASVYGEEAGQAFKQMWSDHIGHFVDYVKGTAANDEEAKQAALEALSSYKKEFSAFIDNATGGRVPADALAKGLQMHVDQLIGAFDAYVAGNYAEAYTNTREAYAHMFTPAKLLSAAIVDQNPESFSDQMPTEMPKTGLEPPKEESEWLGFSLIAALMTMMVGFGVYMRRARG